MDALWHSMAGWVEGEGYDAFSGLWQEDLTS
jgi:hypothetical protein